MVRAAIVLLLLALMPSVAQAEKRIALLIGNKAYKAGVGALVNPLNDIRVVGDALKMVGFEVLPPIQNASRAAMLRAIHDFAGKLKAAGSDAVGFLYYSGHGIASAGENFLIPVDVEEPSTVELNVQGVKHSEVLAILRNGAPSAAHYLVIDACRNTLQGTRGGKGFMPVGQQSGVLVAFAAEPGKTAIDVGQSSGPYAAALATELVRPGQNDLLMFHNVRIAVMEKTSGDQVPWTEDGIQRPQRILFGGETKQPPAAAPSTPPPSAWRPSEAAEAWGATKDARSVAILETFITRYRDTFYAELARGRIEELKRHQIPVTSAPALPPAEATAGRPKIKATDEVPAQPPQLTLPQPVIAVTPTHCAGAESEGRCHNPGAGKTEHFKDCANCQEMVVAPAGRFILGSAKDEPEREGYEEQVPVTIDKPFAVGRFAVTRGQFAAFVAATGHKMLGGCDIYTNGRWKQQVSRNWLSPGFSQTEHPPVVCVSWHDAKSYVTWLSKTTGKTYRLLSEAEREYVARAGRTTPFWWGGTISTTQANYDGNNVYAGGSKGKWRKGTVPVNSFAPNPWGLFNVHGNVDEWTEDCWNANNASNPRDGSARTIGDCAFRSGRGGAWNDEPRYLRAANRLKGKPVARENNQGFRVARSLD